MTVFNRRIVDLPEIVQHLDICSSIRRRFIFSRSLRICFLLFVPFCDFSWPSNCPATTFSFDDIQFWVGTGPNRAAMVIDWVEESTDEPALVWGYRWDGAATGRDMLLAVVAADDRLFAKLDEPSHDPIRVFGLGYDADDDGEFGVEETNFNGSGFAYTNSAPFFGVGRTDWDDYYTEGWAFGFWHYGVAASNPYDGGAWLDVQVGMKGRTLIDGAWDSWTFETTTTPPFNAYAENPIAALPPSAAPGDFNHDSYVNRDDYDVWQRDFRSESQLAADGSGNQIVEAADYVVWRKFFAPPDGAGGTEAVSTPEPATIYFGLLLMLCLSQFTFRKRKD